VTLLDDLPAEQRATLLAVTLQGLSTREVSERDGVPLGTVKTRLRLALHKVRDRLRAGGPRATCAATARGGLPAEPALALLDGDERAAALTHLQTCPACRDEVASLARAADELLL